MFHVFVSQNPCSFSWCGSSTADLIVILRGVSLLWWVVVVLFVFNECSDSMLSLGILFADQFSFVYIATLSRSLDFLYKDVGSTKRLFLE